MQCTSERLTVTLSFENPPFQDFRREHINTGLEIRSGRLGVLRLSLVKVARPYGLVMPRVVLVLAEFSSPLWGSG